MTQCLIRKLFSGVWNVSASHLTTDYYATIAGIKLKWYDCFARNRSIDLVRHSSENKQTTEHRRKRRITLRTSTFTHRTANENNCLKWIWTHAHTKCYSDPENYKSMLIQSSLSLSHSLCVWYSQVKTQTILLNLHEPIEKPLQFAHWMNRLFIWFLHFCDAAKFQEGLTPFCHHSCYSSLSLKPINKAKSIN